MTYEREPHEGAWMYVSLPHGERLQEAVREVCRKHGWPVLAAADQPPQRRLQALQLADACIVDISCATPDAGAELAFALCEGRPVIAFRSGPAASAPLVEDLMREHPAVRQLGCDDVEACVAALEDVLDDPAWQEQVAQATPHV